MKHDPKAIADFAVANPTWSQGLIARHFGCSQSYASAACRAHVLHRKRGCNTPPPTDPLELYDIAIAAGEIKLAAYWRRVALDVANAREQLAARPITFCEYVFKADREYCSNPARNTPMGPRREHHLDERETRWTGGRR
jgi:hypothetical protein